MAELNPLLPLFKEQLEAECAAIASRNNLSKRGLSLIYWYFTKLHNFTDVEVGEILCDGGGDLAIDAIWIDDESYVHFYQFKHPEDPAKGIPAGEVDKMISGLRLILNRKHDTVANPALKEKVDEIYQQVPKGYRIHLISSGVGVSPEARVKMDSLVDELKGSAKSLVAWDEQALKELQEQFYQQSLPAVKDPLRFEVLTTPYAVRSGAADCYLFHVAGEYLADLYAKHGEGLLERNIRVDQGDTATNKSIEATCAGTESKNFLHYNNGVTFLCAAATHDGFQRTLTLEGAQVVNGGQTIRALSRAKKKGTLQPGVLVAARAITASGDKEFANNVTVNQNNQNQVRTGFLRSNDPRVVQLGHALASLGWYLERREGELKTATPEELAGIEQRIGRPLEGHVIRLKEGAQAYTATFFQEPELAKKNPKKIFLSVGDGGDFEHIFSTELTAEKMVVSHSIRTFIEAFVREFSTIWRTVQASDNMKSRFKPVLGEVLASRHSEIIHQVIPQCSLFICGTVYFDLVRLQKKDPADIPSILASGGKGLIQEHLLHIINYAKNSKDKESQGSWPALLKSSAFFASITAYLTGIRTSSNS